MRILLVDDHPLFIEGIRRIVLQLSEATTIETSGSCEEALELTEGDDDFDLVLLDLNLPGISGLEGLRLLRHRLPASPVVLVSASEDRSIVLNAIEQGAKGYISKASSADIILNALRLVLSGGVYLPLSILDTMNQPAYENRSSSDGQSLTPRQTEVLRLLADGRSNKSIAIELDMAENTVRVHVSAILRYLEVNNRTEAGMAAMRKGLLS